MPRVEETLPKSILDRASIKENEYAWHPDDLPEVIRAAQACGLAVQGGTLQVRFLDSTAELYWIEIMSKTRERGEPWNEYVKNCADTCLQQLSELRDRTNFVKEALHAFPSLREEQERGIDLARYLYFVVDFDDEASYNAHAC